MFIPISKSRLQLQDSLALSTVPVMAVSKDTLKTKLSYYAFSITAVDKGANIAEMYSREQIPVVAW